MQVLHFPAGLGPSQQPGLRNAAPGPVPRLAGYLLSVFTVSLFLLMIGGSAFSNWWLGFWLDQGSQVSLLGAPGTLQGLMAAPEATRSAPLPPEAPPPRSCGQPLPSQDWAPETPFSAPRQRGHRSLCITFSF